MSDRAIAPPSFEPPSGGRTSADPASFVARPFRDEDVPAVVDLFAEAFGRRITPEYYRWKLRQREAPVDNIALAIDLDDRPVFHLGGVPARACIGGQIRWVMVAVDAMTAERARRQGLLTTHAGRLYDAWRAAGIAVVLGMPNERYGSRARILGWKPLTCLEWMLLPLRPESILARKLNLPWLGQALRVAGGAWRRFMVPRLRGGRAGDEVEVHEVAAVDAGLDALWERVQPRLGPSIVRDASWVRWRYLGEPSHRYRVLQATRGASVVGYLVCGVAEPHAITIPEIFTAPRDAQTFEALVCAALDRYGDTAESLRTLVVPGSSTQRQLSRLGFLGTGRRFEVEFIPLDPSLADPRGAPGSSPWHISGGDFDVV